MAESQLTAKSVALRQLGYSVPEHDVGVTIYVIDPGSPAWDTSAGRVTSSPRSTGYRPPIPWPSWHAVRSHRAGRHGDHPGGIHRPPDARPRRLGPSRFHRRRTTRRSAFLGIGDPGVPVPAMGTQPDYDFPFPVKHQQRRHRRPLGRVWPGPSASSNTLSGGAPDRRPHRGRHRDHPSRRHRGRRRGRRSRRPSPSSAPGPPSSSCPRLHGLESNRPGPRPPRA